MLTTIFGSMHGFDQRQLYTWCEIMEIWIRFFVSIAEIRQNRIKFARNQLQLMSRLKLSLVWCTILFCVKSVCLINNSWHASEDQKCILTLLSKKREDVFVKKEPRDGNSLLLRFHHEKFLDSPFSLSLCKSPTVPKKRLSRSWSSWSAVAWMSTRGQPLITIVTVMTEV